MKRSKILLLIILSVGLLFNCDDDVPWLEFPSDLVSRHYKIGNVASGAYPTDPESFLETFTIMEGLSNGGGGDIAVVTVPVWVKQAIDAYIETVGIQSGRLFQAMSKSGQIQHDHICGETVRDVVKMYARQCGFEISPHDLRRSYAKLALKNGAKIDQIQLNLGHHSLATTQVYLGNDLDLKNGPGDFLDINIE